jgi:hypothetical protein
MFFAHAGKVRAYAVVTKGPYQQYNGFYIDVGYFHEIKEPEKLTYHGWPQLRYLDKLASQYSGAYAPLCKSLLRIVAEYRAW